MGLFGKKKTPIEPVLKDIEMVKEALELLREEQSLMEALQKVTGFINNFHIKYEDNNAYGEALWSLYSHSWEICQKLSTPHLRQQAEMYLAISGLKIGDEQGFGAVNRTYRKAIISGAFPYPLTVLEVCDFLIKNGLTSEAIPLLEWVEGEVDKRPMYEQSLLSAKLCENYTSLGESEKGRAFLKRSLQICDSLQDIHEIQTLTHENFGLLIMLDCKEEALRIERRLMNSFEEERDPMGYYVILEDEIVFLLEASIKYRVEGLIDMATGLLDRAIQHFSGDEGFFNAIMLLTTSVILLDKNNEHDRREKYLTLLIDQMENQNDPILKLHSVSRVLEALFRVSKSLDDPHYQKALEIQKKYRLRDYADDFVTPSKAAFGAAIEEPSFIEDAQRSALKRIDQAPSKVSVLLEISESWLSLGIVDRYIECIQDAMEILKKVRDPEEREVLSLEIVDILTKIV